ncbi:DUF523 domain-containing protein [Niallia sp. Krafla_26]|uniref:DUF523 domain-containing protein n=1 Tax=Niallia sp. Krafla_26 TaxID=3064703 RepID=UPI003D1674AE
MILVSACLIGLNVKYDGSNNFQGTIDQWLKDKKALPVCPEVLGGLSIPRDPAEIVGGDGEDVLDGKAKVITKYGRDVTDAFIKGAQESLKTALDLNATSVILKERSPSCGSTMIYSGDFNGNKKIGQGVTTALLRRNGINVYSEENFDDIMGELGDEERGGKR